jgi:hypothetical protein
MIRWPIFVLMSCLAVPSGTAWGAHRSTVPVGTDGTFHPPVLNVDEGDTPDWTGDGFAFALGG